MDHSSLGGSLEPVWSDFEIKEFTEGPSERD